MTNREKTEVKILVDKINEGTCVFIKDCSGDTLKLTCKLHNGKWDLYDENFYKYACCSDTLSELRNDIVEDWFNDLILDIVIDDVSFGGQN